MHLGSSSRRLGRLIDAVLAVSTLAIASTVAWADWEMSCCGIGVDSEAMSQVLGGQVLIMVRIGGNFTGEGYDTKMSNISGTVGPIYFIFGHNILEGVPYH